ncbi:MAG: TrmH family RNA methyltransferase [Candidatus Cyclobacteriaceae bacterium M2_1C_046]
MISKATAKFIKSLQLKKYRRQHQAFLVEGAKNVLEVLKEKYPVKFIAATSQFLNDNRLSIQDTEIYEANEDDLQVLGTFKTNNAAIAVAEIIDIPEPEWHSVNYAIVLDQLNDPGNLGTIIRLADWYGIKNIIASPDTADLYNPKVINATKGSFLRVNLFYKELAAFFKENPKRLIGTFMEGTSVHQYQWPEQGYIIMGNEARGISPEIEALVEEKITIPKFGQAESLNVAIATAVICDNWRRYD